MTTDNQNPPDNNAEIYRDTVFLPKTEFPMRGELPKKEPEIAAKWEAMNLYQKQRDASKGKPKWVLHWGPPYANGRAHIGHAMTKTLKDVVNRSWQMMGYDAPLVPGWDCHGLPIEWKIEEKYRDAGKDKDDIDILTFRQECRDFAMQWVKAQTEDFQRLGVLGDFKNPYLTMTNHAESRIAQEIHKFVLNGGLYKGVKPVMWSIVEKTALAEAEVEYKEHKSITVWIKFPVVKTPHKILEGASVVIWTTTPWTLPSNRGIAYGDDIEYGVYELNDGKKLVLALTLADAVKAQAKIEDWKLLEKFKGSDFADVIAAHPLRGKGYDFDVPLLSGDFVTADAGTGFVHIAPGHGADDFFLGQAKGLEVTDNVTDDGKFREHVPLFAGLEVYTQKGELGQGNFAVLKVMDEAGALLAKGSMRHEYPHSWRSKAPLIFRTTPQWFIAMDNEIHLRKTALKAIAETKWIPAAGENRIRAMIEQRPDWCISRQRTWGVPIALFLNKKTGEVLKDEKVFKTIVDLFEKEGSDAWWKRPAQDFLGANYKVEDYDQIFDIVDVWFESGCTHAFVCEDRPELHSPADLYLEGSDQHRGWFHSSLLESCGTRGHAPYKHVLTHGFVLDEKGRKMSKSEGNVVDPNEMMQTHGADILRLWVMLSDYAEDIRIGKDTIKMTGDLYRRIRNTFRYLLGALDGFTTEEKISEADYSKMPELERLMLHHLYKIDKTVRGHIEAYQFGDMAKLLHHFCNNELSAFYFDIRKVRLYCDRPDSFERRACRTVMAHIFDCLVTWLAPMLCFTTEEAWSHRPASFEKAESVHLREFPKLPQSWRNSELEKKWATVQNVRSLVLAAIEPQRKDKTIGSSLEANPAIQVSKDDAAALQGVDIAETCITSNVTIRSASETSVSFAKAEGCKCARCWKVLPEVGEDKEHPSLCNRCADAVRHAPKKKQAA